MENNKKILNYFEGHKEQKFCDECLSGVLKIEPKSQVTSIIKKELSDELGRDKFKCSLCGKIRVCNFLKEQNEKKEEVANIEKTAKKLKLVNNYKTAVELMKARYEAYERGDIEFIVATHDLATTDSLDIEETRKWALGSTWLGLEILSVEKGQEKDTVGIVEFIARFIEDGEEKAHHEKSRFIKREGQWFYSQWLPTKEPIVKGKKTGVNDPCPCGSGKKYKKCCKNKK